MHNPEQYNLLAAVKSVHRNLSLARLATLGVVTEEWNPAELITEHGDKLGAGNGIVTYRSAPLTLPMPLFGESRLRLKSSHASFDLARDRFQRELELNPRYEDSVRHLVHQVEESVFLLNLSHVPQGQKDTQEFASVFLMPDVPPFAVHEHDLQYAYGEPSDSIDVDLLPKLDVMFEGASRTQLDKNQCGAIVTALAASKPRFYTEEDYYLL